MIRQVYCQLIRGLIAKAAFSSVFSRAVGLLLSLLASRGLFWFLLLSTHMCPLRNLVWKWYHILLWKYVVGSIIKQCVVIFWFGGTKNEGKGFLLDLRRRDITKVKSWERTLKKKSTRLWLLSSTFLFTSTSTSITEPVDRISWRQNIHLDSSILTSMSTSSARKSKQTFLRQLISSTGWCQNIT